MQITKSKQEFKLVDILNDPTNYKDDMIIVEKLNTILNTPPPMTWVKKHPNIPNYLYLPIDKVEYLLKKLFKVYKIEVLKTGMLLNSVEVTVRVHYYNPAIKEMTWHDGVGACEVQTAKDSGPLKLDMSNINRGAIAMALPIAKTVAIKDACDHLGDIFGANLNRKDIIQFEPDMAIIDNTSIYADLQELFEIKRDNLLADDIIAIERIITNKESDKYKFILNKLKSL